MIFEWKKKMVKQAFLMIDKILYSGIKWISDLITKPWDINIDFADIRVVMQNSWNALLGIGYGAWEKRAVDAARKAIENPLLETNIDKAKNVIFAVAWGLDLTPTEVQEAASVIEDIIDPEVNMIWGMSLDESMEDEVQVTIIATGFEEQSKDPIIKSPNRDMLWRPTAPKKVTESFIERIVRTNNEDDNDEIDTEEDNNQWEGEDLETPAFMRKRLNPEN